MDKKFAVASALARAYIIAFCLLAILATVAGSFVTLTLWTPFETMHWRAVLAWLPLVAVGWKAGGLPAKP